MTLVGSLRFARHEFLLWRRTWYGSVFSIFVAPILFLAGIGLGVGQLVEDGGPTAALGGVSYAAFAGTGLLAAHSMDGGVNDLSWPVMGNLLYTRTWEATTATPLSPADVVGGLLVFVATRIAMAAVVFGAAMAVLGLVPPAGALVMVAPAVLVGIACGTPMLAFVARFPEGVHVSNLWRFVVIPLFILSGTFFPIEALPSPVQGIAVASPLWHGAELIRLAGLGQPTAHPAVLHVVVLLACAVGGGVLAVRSMTGRLQP